MTSLMLTRRRVVGLFATLTAIAVLPFASGRSAGGRDPRAARLARIFSNRASARAIGRAYLSTVPDEADVPLLVDLLLAGGIGRAVAAGDDAALRREVVHRQQEDFAAGVTATVDGWILSRTECRLCALAALV